MSFTAKNALKSRYRFPGGILDPLNFVELFYSKSRSGYFYLNSARLMDDFYRIRLDYNKLELAFHFLRLASRGSHQGLSDNKPLFNLLGNSLKSLEKMENINLSENFSGSNEKLSSFQTLNDLNKTEDLKLIGDDWTPGAGSCLKKVENLKMIKIHFEIKYLYYLGFLSPVGEIEEFVRKPVSEFRKVSITGKIFSHIRMFIDKQLKEVLGKI